MFRREAMRPGYSGDQYHCGVVILEGGETLEEILAAADEYEARYDNGDEKGVIVRFPGRPNELYTEVALKKSLPPRCPCCEKPMTEKSQSGLFPRCSECGGKYNDFGQERSLL